MASEAEYESLRLNHRAFGWREFHGKREFWDICQRCETPMPCDVISALADRNRLTALLAERDAEVARLREALLENAESTGADGEPCWCGYDTVYYQHADWCKRARAALAARGGEG